MNKTIQYKPDIACDNCGRFGVYDFGDEHLCSDCYQERGSCCVEFGGYDLWKEKEKTTKADQEKNKKIP